MGRGLSMKRARKSKIDEALDAHMRELECFFCVTRPKDELSSNEIRKLQMAFDVDASLPRRRGRPFAHRTTNEETFQSYEAFVFVAGELRIFKKRNDLRQVPKRVREKFIEFAKRDQMCPKAIDHLIEDHLNTKQRIFQGYDELTFFQLVRHKYEDGTVANVILAMPANERLKLCKQE
jgi:hypothetical protein